MAKQLLTRQTLPHSEYVTGAVILEIFAIWRFNTNTTAPAFTTLGF
jgi:hypothetical protein